MPVTYSIDSQDRITQWCEEYSLFAAENNGRELSSASMQGRSLWDFIEDPQTRLVYRSLIERARDGVPVVFNFRCDGPTTKRHLQMTIMSSDAGDVDFRVATVWTVARGHQPLLERGALRSDHKLPFCSWCSRIRTGVERWDEVEEAVTRLGLLDGGEVPRLEYVMCDHCYSTRMPQAN